MAIIKYNGRGSDEYRSEDGGKSFTNQRTGEVSGGKTNGSNNSGSSNVSKSGQNSGWNNYTGATGKQYSVAGSNGTIQVTRPDGTTSLVRPTDANYAATQQAMQSDLRGNGVDYTPNHTFTNQNGTYTTKDYVNGNNNLKYALEQAAKNSGNGKVGTDDYAKSLYNRVGSQRADGSTVTLEDVNNELNRLGLGDYASNNAIYTASGNLLPGNEFVKQHTGADGSNSADSLWWSYGGQDYLAGANGGDSANYAQYVNGKTGNLDNLSFIFGDMQNNPYAQQDKDFMAAYNAALNQFNAAANIQGNQSGTVTGNYSPTGNQNVDNVINYVNSLNNYNAAIGNTGATSNLLEMLQGYLNSGLQANKDFIAQQREQAEKAAQSQASDAWVNSRLAQNAMKEQMSALGLGTSGALQSAQLGLQGDYSNNLNTINSNLNTMLSNLSQQELQVLSDYYNNMTNYTYQVTNDEANRALQQAQLALQQQQAAYEREYQQKQLAMQQAYYDWQQQQTEREWQNTLSQQEYDKKLQQANNYWDAYNAGVLGDEGLYNALSGLGMVNNGYWPNGSYTGGATLGQMQRQQGALDLQNSKLQNAYLQAQTNWMNRR